MPSSEILAFSVRLYPTANNSGGTFQPIRWWLDYVPRFMRTWPWLRRFYWQADEIEAIQREADALAEFFDSPHRRPTP